MSSSSSEPTAPPINPQPQLESAINIPPDPGNSFHTSLTDSTVSTNNHPIHNLQNQNANQTVITFNQVLQYYWRGNNEYQNDHNIAYPTRPQISLAQNVYPLVIPMRKICFFISQISFILACGFFMKTELYKTHVGTSGGHNDAPSMVFYVLMAIALHIIFVTFLLFFNFFTLVYERYRHHDLLKSLGELIVMESMSFLISSIEHNKKHQGESPEFAVLVTCAFLTIDFLCIIILLKPGHHYSLLDAILTLILHLGLKGQGTYAIPVTFFAFVILAIKNFLWRTIVHAQAPTNEQIQLDWSASDEIVLYNLSSV